MDNEPNDIHPDDDVSEPKPDFYEDEDGDLEETVDEDE
jgi:hypothetical protein